MSYSTFDAIIDDCFLDGAARILTRKYTDRINLRAAKIIASALTQDESKRK